MDAAKIEALLNLIEKAEVFPPNTEEDQTEWDAVVARRRAIIAKAEADIDTEVATT